MYRPQAGDFAKKLQAQLWYEALAKETFERRDVVFMNYGFANLEPGSTPIPLTAAQEKDRFAIQNYHYLVERIPLAGKDVLEVGSGRGGGAAYLKQTFRPRKLVGIDISEAAVRFCRDVHPMEGLSFVVGDAESIPLANNSFDVVLNVESSHCYASVEAFLYGVYRVLRPGGHFLITDLRWNQGREFMLAQLAEVGFQIDGWQNVSRNVFASLQDESETRRRLELLPLLGINMSQDFPNFAGVPSSHSYRSLKEGTAIYLRCYLRKPV